MRPGLAGPAAALLVVLILGCSSPSPVPEPVVPATPEEFSGAIARTHLDALEAIGARRRGSEADRKARRYLVQGFQQIGAEVRSLADGPRRHLVAELPGDSEDVLLLVAAYPVLEQDEWIGDSGAALLLEMARAESLTRPPYTLAFALAETRDLDVFGPDAAGEGAGSANGTGKDRNDEPLAPVQDGPERARQRVVFAGQSLARSLAVQGDFERLRGVIVFDGSSRSGLRVARDLGSHPVFRELFWESAASLGYQATFPRDVGWAAPRSLQLGFEELSMDRVLTLVDEARARPDLASVPVQAGDSNDSLEAVGRVSIEAVDRLMHRLARIDSFARDDLDAQEAPDPPSSTPRLDGAEPAASGQASPQVPESSPSS
jgi:hypothetical protein